jgi:murein DD-endopeptidase MepM/ murein hydrolase activator NlpD
MGEARFDRRGRLRGAVAVAFIGLLAGCASGPPPGAAPVILMGGGPGVLHEAAVAPVPPPMRAPRLAPLRPLPLRPLPPPGEGRQIVVRPGQSVGGLARDYHVPERAIIAANRLTPPYKIEIGQRLLIPDAGAVKAPPPEIAAARRAPPRRPEPAPPEIIPLDGPAPASPSSASHAAPEQRAAVEPHAPPAPHAARAAEASGTTLPHGGRLPWPVHGRILADYGAAAGGGRNDGINIAAPRGTPVRAVDGGVVAYAGNELRGYGNLVLIKHPDGFISAYAHCERLLVRRGERVRRGQVIARVGATGGVSEPQLHFELRRGQQAVDPRNFLAPASRAESGSPSRRS